jgi:hypothetical protein
MTNIKNPISLDFKVHNIEELENLLNKTFENISPYKTIKLSKIKTIMMMMMKL